MIELIGRQTDPTSAIAALLNWRFVILDLEPIFTERQLRLNNWCGIDTHFHIPGRCRSLQSVWAWLVSAVSKTVNAAPGVERDQAD